MKFDPKTVRKTINKAFLKEPVERTAFNHFKDSLGQLLDQIDTARSKNEHEEHFKNFLEPFFNSIGFKDYKINTSGRIDLAVYNGSKAKDPVGVLMEVKRPGNSAEMITKDRLNRKAMHEAVLYYLEQRIEQNNSDLKHVIITDMDDWFIFDAQEFERCFYKPSVLRKTWEEWKADRKVSSNNDFMYAEISAFMDKQETAITGLWLPLGATRKFLKGEKDSDYEKKLIPVYKLFTPTHLLKEPFANDSNSLNREFYRELLYILGLEETKKGNTRYIQRASEENRNQGSLIENTIRILDVEDHLSTLKGTLSNYGSNRDEQLFNVAMELSITWMNRVLFLKLLEAQLFRYHRQDKNFKFLNYDTIDGLDELNKLFFHVLARKEGERSDDVNEKFGHIPYLNSSLFDVSSLERQTTRISGLDDHAEMPVYGRSVLSRERGNTLNTLDYLFRFLDAYDFSAEGSEEIRDERKSLINASVLGLIFEKINGYKDGSFYTPGFITEYMARETLQKAVTDAFNKTCEWNCNSFDELYNQIHREKLPLDAANEVINSLKICDPAVGSGHFLVSCLNELIAIKSRLDILCDSEGKILRQIEVTVENDELIISWGDEGLFEYDVSHSWKGSKLSSRRISPELERVQQALFHEKRYLIENCLFGVDINPNSVKICRLRLWIELLKRAYYTPESNFMELEVLPNIDINIKQGNSLVSRFELDSDLSSVFKKSDYSLDDYKEAVRSYKHTGDRTEKQRLQRLIDEIKEEYTTTLTNIRPINKKLSKERGKLELMQSDDLFGEVKFTKKQIKKQEQKVQKLEEQKAEEESGAFYNQAFEWRFEFPEVLDDEGRFSGFDVVIGNPPYIGGREWKISKNLYDYFSIRYEVAEYQFDTYLLFWELSVYLTNNYVALITPNTWLNNQKNKKLRQFILKHSILSIADYSKTNVFEDATVLPIITILEKKGARAYEKTTILSPNDNEVQNLVQKNSINQNLWGNDDLCVINIDLKEEDILLINRVESNSQMLEEISDIRFGIKLYETGKGTPPQKKSDSENKIFEADEKIDESYRPYLTGKNIDRYLIKWQGRWLKYGENLAAPRDPSLFEGQRILVRRIVGDRLICAYTNKNYVTSQMLQIVKPQQQNDTLLLISILNSRLISHYFRIKYNRQDITFPEIRLYELKSFPIPKTLGKFSKKIELNKIAQDIIQMKNHNPEADTTELEEEIDRLVYELYGLSEEEIGVVVGDAN